MPFVELSTEEAPGPHDATLRGAWTDGAVVVAAHDEGWAIRLVIIGMASEESASESYSFDELQRIKREVGFGDPCAVEIYPAERNVRPGPGIRHLWVLPEGLHVGWEIGNESSETGGSG